MEKRPLLMIPGPVEVSPAVRDSYAAAPPGHLAPGLVDAFGRALERMRQVWLAGPDAQPLVVPGGGTLGMEMAAANLVEAGDRALVVDTGFFSARMSEMLRRYGAEVEEVVAAVGDAPGPEEVAAAIDRGRPPIALFATHVDTSTGVRVDPAPLADLARRRGLLSVFDGVCATGGERFDMAGWGADVYLTASQKALSLPPGLALTVATPAALEARRRRRGAPPLALDWEAWTPIMEAYEARSSAYFSTPATNLILALDVGLGELLADGMEVRFELQQRAGRAMRAAWATLELPSVPIREEITADTLSALRYPPGSGATLLGRLRERGIVAAGGLHPEIKDTYFRLGHMGYTTTRPEMLLRAVEAVSRTVTEDAARASAAVAAAESVLAATEADPAVTGRNAAEPGG